MIRNFFFPKTSSGVYIAYWKHSALRLILSLGSKLILKVCGHCFIDWFIYLSLFYLFAFLFALCKDIASAVAWNNTGIVTCPAIHTPNKEHLVVWLEFLVSNTFLICNEHLFLASCFSWSLTTEIRKFVSPFTSEWCLHGFDYLGKSTQ